MLKRLRGGGNISRGKGRHCFLFPNERNVDTLQSFKYEVCFPTTQASKIKFAVETVKAKFNRVGNCLGQIATGRLSGGASELFIDFAVKHLPEQDC